MKLASILEPRFIKVKSRVESKDEAVHLILDNFLEHYDFKTSKETILEAVIEREKLGGSVMPSGLTILRARIPDFDDLLVGICVPKVPIPRDDSELKMLVLVLISRTASKLFVNVMSALTELPKDPGLFAELIGAKDANHFIRVLDKANIQVKKELFVRDIMARDLVTVRPGTTLKEVVDSFYKHDISYAPVVDETGKFLGELDVLDLMKLGIPNYALMIGNLRFLHSFEPFEELFEKEDRILVENVMRKPVRHLDPGDSVIEAAFELEQNRRRILPVVEDGRIVGIIGCIDILEKLLRR
jgi:PTS system nitrogen regulatory IIA component